MTRVNLLKNLQHFCETHPPVWYNIKVVGERTSPFGERMSDYKLFANYPKQTLQLIADRFEAKEAEIAAELEAAKAGQFSVDEGARICDLLDMIVDEKVKTEDYNYVVEQLQAMMAV